MEGKCAISVSKEMELLNSTGREKLWRRWWGSDFGRSEADPQVVTVRHDRHQKRVLGSVSIEAKDKSGVV